MLRSARRRKDAFNPTKGFASVDLPRRPGSAAIHVARAQGPTGGALPPAAETTAHVAPPSLKTRVEAAYRPRRRAIGIEPTVGLELEVDEAGDVIAARVMTPGGHGFEIAALAVPSISSSKAAKQEAHARALYHPALLRFHLPPLRRRPCRRRPRLPLHQRGAADSGPQSGPDSNDDRPRAPSHQRGVLVRRAGSEFQLRPIGSVQDILRVTRVS